MIVAVMEAIIQVIKVNYQRNLQLFFDIFGISFLENHVMTNYQKKYRKHYHHHHQYVKKDL